MGMNIVMSGVDHACADLARRERFALTAEQAEAALACAKQTAGVRGAVVLATCNRTEVYVSLEDGADVAPFSLLPHVAPREWEGCVVLRGEQAFSHLAQTACGLNSRIFAEDQILTQVKNALRQARAAQAADGALEVFFREAIAAAKRVKTELRFSHGDASAATAARDLLLANSEARRMLVIGNGEMGRACADECARAGLAVTMTQRRFRHGEVAVPHGVSVIDYAARYERLGEFDAVVSATASPHYTLTAEQLAGRADIPRLYLDLAVPRDIEPAVALLPGVRVWNIDEIADSTDPRASHSDELAQAEELIAMGWRRVRAWEQKRESREDAARRTHFPLFVACGGKTALVVGGGKVASRRVQSLCLFDFDVKVISPEVTDELAALAESGKINLARRSFEDGDIDGAFLAVAATDDRAVNRRIAALARHRGVFASIADRAEECSFYFPAIAAQGEITAGVCGDGASHHKVAQAAKSIREALWNELH